MNKQSNVYTLLYSSILVIVVGAVLAIVYGVLNPKHDENIAIDKQKQILSSVRVYPSTAEVSGVYAQMITKSFVVNVKGEVVSEDAATAFGIDMAKEIKKAAEERQLPVYVCTIADGSAKYILPVYGKGLWNAIWGYVAFNDDANTIYGAYFSHVGETPGLGAEIESTSFQYQFQNRTVFNENGEFTSVAVCKKGQELADTTKYVNAISGGTITSRGVEAMLKSCLGDYQAYLTKLKESSTSK